MKTLVLMRHGDASQAENDFARRLSPRGELQCQSTAQQFIDAGFRLDRVLCSSALRAVKTAELVAEHCGFRGPVETRSSLYLAEPKEYLEAISQTSHRVNCMLLVAHNPGLSVLAGQLRQTRISLSTGDYAVVRLKGNSWSDLAKNGANTRIR